MERGAQNSVPNSGRMTNEGPVRAAPCTCLLPHLERHAFPDINRMAEGEVLRGMARNDKGRGTLLLQDGGNRLFPICGVKPGKGLIEEKHIARDRECPHDGNAPSHAAGELPHRLVQGICGEELFQCLPCNSCGELPAHHSDVLHGGERLAEPVLLKDRASFRSRMAPSGGRNSRRRSPCRSL